MGLTLVGVINVVFKGAWEYAQGHDLVAFVVFVAFGVLGFDFTKLCAVVGADKQADIVVFSVSAVVVFAFFGERTVKGGCNKKALFLGLVIAHAGYSMVKITSRFLNAHFGLRTEAKTVL